MKPVVFRLRELRQAANLTQRELAAKAGTRQATISDLETRKSQGLDFDTLARLARALKVDPGEFFTRG